MFFRLSLSLVLIGAGIASPWLVQDWLAAQPSERRFEGWVERTVKMPGKWKEWILPDRKSESAGSVVDSPSSSEEKIALEIHTEDSTGATRESYPLASRTSRVLRGLLPGGTGESGRLGSTASTATSFSKSVTEETGEILDQELDKVGLKRGSPVFIRIFKEEKELEVWLQRDGESHFELFKVFRLRDVSGVLGPKLREGDRQSPEGFYFVSSSRMRPATRHHLGMDLGYPNEFDSRLERSGGEIMIHGGISSNGSFVLAPEYMNEVFTLAESCLREGHRYFRVHVFPFRMTDKRMEKEWAQQPKWIDFWANLKEGYDFFENAQFPPSVEVEEGEYVFRFPETP